MSSIIERKIPDYIYTFNYDYHHSELCKLESRQLFDAEENDKLLFSDTKIDPSISPFIRTRIELIASSENYADFLEQIKQENMATHGFKIEYVTVIGDETDFAERREKMKDVGYCIEAAPDFETPSITYAICTYKNTWYFGIQTKQNTDWQKHKKKPNSFSNSIGMNIAKTLVSLASKGDKQAHLLDACCGVGTIMLEACFSGFNIEGCDISLNPCNFTKENLAHYNYSAKVHHSDVKELDKKYDAAIIDLPYNLYSYSNDTITAQIIASTAKLSARIIIVSISDIEDQIKQAGLTISDFCTVIKRGKSNFIRKIWVCERENLPKN